MSYKKNRDKTIDVFKASDLSGALRSDVVYYIHGMIDMGGVEIVVPEDGLFFHGDSYFTSGLFTFDNNHTMFKTNTYSGNIRFKELLLGTYGVNSKIFDLDNNGNFGSAEFISVNFGDFSNLTTSLGGLTAYRQFRTSDCAFIRIGDGLSFSGTWNGGWSINETIVLSMGTGVALFKQGTSLDFQGSSTSNINAATSSVDDNAIIFQFDENDFSRDEGFNLNGARFKIGGTGVPNANVNSTKVFFKDCSGVANTYGGGLMKVTTDVITPLTLNNTVKALGTTTSSNLVYWTAVGNNSLRYDSTVTKDFNVAINAMIDGGPNDDVRLTLRKWVDAISTYVDVDSQLKRISNVVGGVDVAHYNFITTVTVSKNDRLELYITNETDNSNGKLVEDSRMLISVRL